MASQRTELARNGLTQKVLAEAQNVTMVGSKNEVGRLRYPRLGLWLLVVLLGTIRMP